MEHIDECFSIDEHTQKIQYLINIGMEKQPNWSPQNNICPTNKRVEFCTNATLHRGFYHPSPIYDIVVGNTARGRLQRKIPDLQNITHLFLYGANGILDCVETFSKGQVVYLEQLYYSGNIRLGITIDKHNRISTVCEERFIGAQLANFFIVHCVEINDNYMCYSARSEHYTYDELGLCACNLDIISPMSGKSIHKKYVFSRQNGLLTAYTDITSQPNKFYQIKKKRRA